MARIDELEERIEYLETKEKSEITEVFDRDFNAEFYSSGYVTEIGRASCRERVFITV